jgi:hypothetical protein
LPEGISNIIPLKKYENSKKIGRAGLTLVRVTGYKIFVVDK